MKNNTKTISILGSTGSIGVQTLQVMESTPGFEVCWLTSNSNINLLEEQTRKFKPKGVVISDETAYNEFRNNTKFTGQIIFGDDGICEAASDDRNDIVVTALVGFSGVLPTLSAIEKGKTVALANKETLVSAGNIIMQAAEKNSAKIVAIDSEHSAILQCLVGEDSNSIEKIILTASGGPFRTTAIEDFKQLTKAQALEHPNWTMGNKITIDSATMMNKGFEVIEAHYLFNIEKDKIDVLIHPQSIIHSMVQFIDGSVKAQLGLPDMRLPISYALNYPNRVKLDLPRLELSDLVDLSFHKPDIERFPCLGLAYKALYTGGTACSIINGANEIAVTAFLNDEIKFTQIYDCIERTFNRIQIIENPTLEDIIITDKETRIIAKEIINLLKF
jgi:1-deoxy-D-xylulose-5-phosphate reductoisomerase